MAAVDRAVQWSIDKGVVSAAAAGNASQNDLANKTTDSTSPDDGTPVDRTINDLPGHPDRSWTAS